MFPSSNSCCIFFPPLFSHLICSSFCWTLHRPSPPSPFIPPTAPPTLHPQSHCPAHTVSPATSTSLAPSSVSAKPNRSPGCPGSQHSRHRVCRTLYQACVAGGVRAYFYMKCACVLYPDNRADTLNYSLVSHRHKQRTSRQRATDCTD